MAQSYVMIKDTGKYYIGTTATANQVIAKGDDGVAGTDLTLKGVEINYVMKPMTDDSPTPGLKRGDPSLTANYDELEWREGDIDQTGVENPEWKIKGVLFLNVEDDMKTFGRLINMVKTKGYKELTSEGSSISDYAMPLVNYSQYDHTGDAGAITTINTINVRIVGFQTKYGIGKKNMKKLDYTLELKEIGDRGNP
tara:strand:+ start:232 stop:819 length:588 start_codon:yes stop_codon:yes gene_type:complete